MQAYNWKNIFLLIIFCFLPTLASSQNRHFVDVWGGGGYSSLFHGIDNTKVPGGAGFNLGVGFEYQLNSLMFLGGAEFLHFGSKTNLNNYVADYQFRYDDGTNTSLMDYHYNFQQYTEKHSVGYLNIPLMVGFHSDRYYGMVGTKIGLNLLSGFRTDAIVLPTVTEPTAIDDFATIHRPIPYSKDGSLSLGLNATASAEFGISLDQWLPAGMRTLNNARNTPVSYRVGLFVDYGLLNLNKSATDNPLLLAPQDRERLDIKMNDLSSSSLAQDKRFGNLYTGVKLTVLFQTSTERRRPPAAVQEPILFYAQVVDAETKDVIQTEVAVHYVSGNRQVFKKETDAFGAVEHELRAGRYNVIVRVPGYDAYRKTISHRSADPLLIELQPVPSFFVRVVDAETGQNLHAEVTVNTASDNSLVFKQETDVSTGVMSNKDLKKGRYQLNVTSEGYIYSQSIVNFTQSDMIEIALQPIKKDVRVVLNNLFFELGKADIMPESEPALAELYQFLTDNSTIRIHIVGHTDNTGSLSYNMTLSENRAKAVYDTLITRGIDVSRLSYEGKGPNEPVATNETEEGRAENRRVEFVIQ